jgi:CBS domain-containing protein
MTGQIVEFLAKAEPFSRIPEQDLARIASKMSVMTYPSGSVLGTQGETTLNQIFVIRSGSVELFFEDQGQKRLRGMLNPGEIFGAISILMNLGLSIRTAKVKDDATLYVLPKKAFLDLCNHHASVYDYFAETFSARMVDETYAAIIASLQAFTFLAEVDPFSFLPEEELKKTAGELSIVHHPKDTVVFIQGQSRVDGLYIIQKGAAERYYVENNEKILQGLLGEGDSFGGISMLLNDMIAVRTLRTKESTYFYRLPHDIFFALCNRYEVFSEYYTDIFGKRMLDRSYAAIVQQSSAHRVDALQLFNQPVSSICSRRLVSCAENVTIQEAAAIMSQQRVSSIFVQEPNGNVVGVATDNDLRRKVIAQGYDISRPISDIMSSPLKTIADQALVFEALIQMMQENVKHLAVTDARDQVVGVVTNQDLLSSQGQSPVFLIREISAASRLETIAAQHKRLPRLVQNLISSGALAKNINRFITTISDTTLKKLIEFALEELGPPPVKFVFMIMGSEGRKEQTLKTDQDNAIVFEDVSASYEAEARDYLLNFAERVCNWLDHAGYAFCEGNVMAKNPKLVQPLSVWKDTFSGWIHTAEPEDLLQSSVFFDFRGAYGDMALIEELRNYLFDSLVGWSGFFRHLTENALYFKPPIGFFRNFVVESKGEHRDSLDIKRAMMPIVDYARIYALKNRIEETNTLERLHQLYVKQVIPWQDFNEIEVGYSFMMQLRFARQVSAIIDEGGSADNYINPKKLSGIEQKTLKEIFKRIEDLQTKLGFEFTGMP